MTLKECCDEIARRTGWRRGEYKGIPGMGDWENASTGRSQWDCPIATLDDLVDCWPPWWRTAGHGTRIGDKSSVIGDMSMAASGVRPLSTYRKRGRCSDMSLGVGSSMRG